MISDIFKPICKKMGKYSSNREPVCKIFDVIVWDGKSWNSDYYFSYFSYFTALWVT